MFSKQQRLTTKDVLFLTKKKTYFFNGFFGFFFILQYPNRSYHQTSCHISLKYNKHSTARNILKRAVLSEAKVLLAEGKLPRYYKLFITLNKNKIPELQKEFENLEKKDIIARVQNHFDHSFTALSKHLGKIS